MTAGQLLRTFGCTVLVFASLMCLAQEPDWQPSLASGEAPECPKHSGSRIRRGEIIEHKGTQAYVFGSATRGPRGCAQRAVITVKRAGARQSYPLPDPAHSHFFLVDFSPTGPQLLLQRDIEIDYPYEEHRNFEIAIMPLSTGEMHWHSAWDLFGWKECDATVYAQGFAADGTVVLLVRKSVMGQPRRANCVEEAGLYAVDLASRKVSRLPNSTKVERYGEEVRSGFQPCKSDPDIIEACFTVHGRLSYWNGTPAMRIWRIGTKRILGVLDSFIMPDSAGAGWDEEAYGDYLVCPFTKQKPGWMQMVCIESAAHVFTKRLK
jgi:hypothetical protein